MPENRPWDVITFDCYGTLIDWGAGISDAFREAAAADGVKLDPAAVLRAVFEREPEVQAAHYRTYREVLTVTAMEVAAALGWTVSRERAAFLADSLPRWKPFPDTNAALERLSRAGYELGILSNVDDDLLAGTRRHFTVSFPLLVTAQQVRASGSAGGAGCTPPRATSTTSRPPWPSACRWRGSIARACSRPAPPARIVSSER